MQSTQRWYAAFMRWTRGGTSDNVEDRRVVRGVGVGLGGIVVLGLLSLLTGQNFLALLGPLNEMTQTTTSEEGPIQSTPEEDERVQFVSFVLDDAQSTWSKLLPGRYRPAK